MEARLGKIIIATAVGAGALGVGLGGSLADLVLDVTGDDGGNSLSVGHAPLPEHQREREHRQLELR